MPAWVTPATWINGPFTAAFANAEVRDHLVWLKAALDLITNGTAADSGTGTSMRVIRSAASDASFIAQITGDVQGRIAMLAGGEIEWGTGAATRDVALARGAAGRLEVSSNGGSTAAVLRSVAESGQEGRYEALVTGDVRVAGGAGGTTGLYFGPGSSGPTKVVGERITGWAAATGTATRTTFATGSVTLPQLAERVKALIDDMITHGLIGT
jgi:hypothetical protein